MSNSSTDVEASSDRGTTILRFTVPPQAEGRLDAWLAAQTSELSRARIQALIKEGRVTCVGSRVKASAPPPPGQTIVIEIPPPRPAVPQPESIPLNFIYEDSDLIALNKAPGMVVHPACGHANGTLVNALLYHCSDLGTIGGVERPGIVHRLDMETSGVMVVAKNDRTLTALMRLFKSGAIRKEYLALVHGTPPLKSGTLISHIGRHPVDRKRMAVVKSGGKEAITHYTVEQELTAGVTLVRCRIETGRTHQIRVHLHSLGCPIVGDVTYGRSAADKLLPLQPERQMLHAAHLAFTHPIKRVAMNFDAPLPTDFQDLLTVLTST